MYSSPTGSDSIADVTFFSFPSAASSRASTRLNCASHSPASVGSNAYTRRRSRRAGVVLVRREERHAPTPQRLHVVAVREQERPEPPQRLRVLALALQREGEV